MQTANWSRQVCEENWGNDLPLLIHTAGCVPFHSCLYSSSISYTLTDKVNIHVLIYVFAAIIV